MNRTHLTIVTAMIALSSTTQATENPATALRAADAGRLVSVSMGGDIAILLPTYPGDSFSWRVRSHDGLQIAGPVEAIPDPSRSVGAPGGLHVAIIRLRATRPGRASAVVEQARDGGGFGANYLRYRFIVR